MGTIIIKTKTELTNEIIESIKKLVSSEVGVLWIDTDGDEVEDDIWQTASDIIEEYVGNYEEED